jgi:hypothetical protein
VEDTFTGNVEIVVLLMSAIWVSLMAYDVCASPGIIVTVEVVMRDFVGALPVVISWFSVSRLSVREPLIK